MVRETNASRIVTSDGLISLREQELVVEIDQDQVATWALEVALLLRGLNNFFVLHGPGAERVVLTLRDASDSSSRRTMVSRLDDGGMEFLLSRNQAGYMEMVLLRAYRDGMGEVSHIHIEGELDGALFDLTLYFKVSKPPISAAEMIRLLDE